MIEEKIKILIDLGFVPMVKGEGNTLFRMNDVVMSVSDPNQTPEQLKKEVMSLIKNRDIAERGGQVPVVKEPAPEPEPVQKEEPEAQAEEAAPNPGEEDSNPFTENQETLEPFYICDELKKIETPKFVRLTLDDNRFYVRKMDDGTAKIYASVTTLIKDGYVDDKTALQEWKQEIKMLGRNPEEVAQYEADKGTIMHYLYGLYLTGRDMVLNRSFVVKTVQEGKLKISKKNLDRFFNSIDDLDDMIVRVMKFAKFCSDYKVKPMMIERILSLEDYLVATPIDAMVKMTFKYKEEGYFGAVYQRATGQFKKGDPKMQDYIMEIMEKCGLASYFIHRYPHQFSGGQRQRIGIARSLAVHPKFVVCDEAVSALDVSIQSQIINLLLDLKEQNNLTYLFISHDLSVIKYISDRIGVMYLGNMMELSDTEHLFAHPYHPYTEALLSAIPTTDVDGRKETIILAGDIPSPINPPKGCKFHTRCRYCTEICKNVTPQFEEVEPGHFVACHHKLGVPEEK